MKASDYAIWTQGGWLIVCYLPDGRTYKVPVKPGGWVDREELPKDAPLGRGRMITGAGAQALLTSLGVE